MVGQGDFGHARPPEPFPAPSAQAMVFCDPYLELCSLLRDWLSLLGDSPRQETRS